MAGASADGEMNYWPGFVDALANLVLALVFVVVIFTLALAVISSKMAAETAAREMERLRSQSQSDRETELLEEVARLQALLAAKEKALDIKATTALVIAPPEKSKTVSVARGDIIFTYEVGSFDLDGSALSKLDEVMKAKGGNPATKDFKLTAVTASGAFSQEKRNAYYRLIVLRNHLIDRGVPTDNIKTKTSQDETLPGLRGQVRLAIDPKEK